MKGWELMNALEKLLPDQLDAEVMFTLVDDYTGDRVSFSDGIIWLEVVE